MPSANKQPATLPPASTFDIIPPLHTVLSRLLLSDSIASPTSPSHNGNQGPLSPKDLAAAISEVRARIARARSITAGMQDSDRTIEEQNEEIEELKAVLAKIGRSGSPPKGFLQSTPQVLGLDLFELPQYGGQGIIYNIRGGIIKISTAYCLRL
ncbi:MAG: hypothetical protein Q9169_001596 [Polycauliona sp. 2 TL-2023]